MAYILELESLVATKLSYDDLNNLKLTSDRWDKLISNQRFISQFISKYGVKLPNGADYEVWSYKYAEMNKEQGFY